MKQYLIIVGTLLISPLIFSQTGGVGINSSSNAPNASAMLDIESTTKGLLIPRVPLTHTTDVTTITNGNITSLLVYNTSTMADVVPGYYYWDGTVWKTLGGDADSDPNNEIQDLQLVGNNLTITNNGSPTTIDLSPYLDNTDDQNIDSLTLNGNNLTVYIESGSPATIDLSDLASDHDWYELGGTSAPDNINDDIYTQGNVGIGTVTPQERLDISAGSLRMFNGGSVSYNLNVQNNVIAGTNFAGPTFTAVGTNEELLILAGVGGTATSARLLIDNDHGVNTSPMYGFKNDVNTGISAGIGDANFLKFITDGQERVRIAPLGNVGIGTTSPNSKLTVKQTLDNVSASGIQIENTAGTSNSLFTVTSTGATYIGGENSYDGPGANIDKGIYIRNTTGYVGIGTDVPSTNLDIVGGPNPLRIERTGVDAWMWTIDANRMHFFNPGTGNYPISINKANLVGINNTAPSHTLDVLGTVKITDGTQGTGKVLTSNATGVASWQDVGVPPGAIMPFAMVTPPNGWLACDGSAVSRTTYASLFSSIGVTYGAGDGSTTFNLPDLRGEFIRGADNGRGADIGRTLGSFQTGTKVTNDNGAAPAVQTIGNINLNSVDPTDINMDVYHSAATTVGNYGSQYVGMVRPRNVALNYCIKF